MRLFLTLFILVFTQNIFSQAVNYEWGIGFTSHSNVRCLDVTHDNLGNIYITGIYTDSVDFDPSIGELISVPTGNQDVFIVKFSATGDLIWGRFLPTSSGYILPIKITSDNSGDLYLAGNYDGTQNLTIGNGPSDVRTAKLQGDIFILKFSSDGNSIWSKSYGTDGYDNFTEITIDQENNLIFTGGIGYASGEYDADATGFSTTNGSHDIVITKLNSSGDTQWIRSFGASNGLDYGTGVATDFDNNIYVCGTFQNTISFPSIQTTAQSSGGGDVIILKLTPNGDLLMVKDFGGTGQDSPYDIDVDDDGNIYTIGKFQNSIDIDPSYVTNNLTSFANGVFMQKLDSLGDFQWAENIGNSYSNFFGHLKLDNFGFPIFVLDFYGTINYGGGIVANNPNGTDFLVARFNPNGMASWLVHSGSNIVGSSANPQGFSIDLNNNISICGAFSDEIDLDPTSGVDNFVALPGITANDHSGFNVNLSVAYSGLNENYSLSNTYIHPNPTNGIFHLKTPQNGIAKIFDSAMHELKEVQITSGDNVIELPENLGVYFVQFISESRIEVVKVVKSF